MTKGNIHNYSPRQRLLRWSPEAMGHQKSVYVTGYLHKNNENIDREAIGKETQGMSMSMLNPPKTIHKGMLKHTFLLLKHWHIFKVFHFN